MDTLRAPDDRFRDLPGYPFASHYVDIPDGEGGTLRVHHADEGGPDAPVVLLLHGEPSWSYLYRHMIPVVVANTFLPTGDRHPGDAFLAWQAYSQEVPELPIGRIVNGGCTTDLDPAVIAAYDAPFPDESYKEGARQFPALVPTSPDDPEAQPNRDAWESLRRFDKPFLCAFGDSDPITRGADRPLRELIPGAAGQPHTTIEGGGHFLQEDRGPELARVVVDFVRSG